MKFVLKNRLVIISSIAFFLSLPFYSISRADVDSFHSQAQPFSVLPKTHPGSLAALHALHPDVPVQNDEVVGNLSGSFAVSPEGSATYDIPIKMSPGTAGMAPTLSLHYDS